MAIYRFRVTFEDYDDVYREIDLFPKHTFLDLHQAIHKSLGYDPEMPSSFYASDDQWRKGQEITYLPNERRKQEKVILMENAKLSQFIDDPHQKFYYTYDFNRPYDFHVQLIRILKEEEGKEYPSVFKSVGVSPRSANSFDLATSSAASDGEEDDFDFLNEEEYTHEDSEDMDFMDDDPSLESEEEGNEETFGDEQQDDY